MLYPINLKKLQTQRINKEKNVQKAVQPIVAFVF